jgi:signal transduction histidine kinase
VGAGQHADLGHDRADGLHVAAVDAGPRVYAAVDAVKAKVMAALVPAEGEARFEAEKIKAAFKEAQSKVRLHGVDGGVALLLDGLLVGLAQLGLADLQHRLLDLGVVGRLEVARRRASTSWWPAPTPPC